jgi:transposase-like protein
MFRPPFCPRNTCSAHYDPPRRAWWVRRGSYVTAVKGTIPRFRCRLCGVEFSAQTFNIDYYAKRLVDYRSLVWLQIGCMGLRQMARYLKVSNGTVENKTMRFARQALALHAELIDGLGLDEDVCADGLQSYWVSQYVPNNITVLAGSDSRFLYWWNAVSLRRSGAMTEGQKKRRDELEKRWKADPGALRGGFGDICDALTRLIGDGERELTILDTDEHPAYLRALDRHGAWAALKAAGRVAHRTTSSEEPRTQLSPLAAVNTIDRQIRIDFAEHVRETVRFARNPNRSTERFAVWGYAYNYRKRYLINQPVADTTTHAQKAGIEQERVERACRGLYSRRRFLSHTPLVGWMRVVWLRMHDRPFAKKPEYLPAYLLA